MSEIIVSIRDDTVTVFHKGVRSISHLSDWSGNTKGEILLEYWSLRQNTEGGEVIE